MTTESAGAPQAPVYVILGGTGGIGSVLVRRLAAAGNRVVIAARDEARVRALAEETGAHGMTVDARVPDAVKALFAAVAHQYGRVDGTVNCVGSVFLKPAHGTSPTEWDETIATNLTSAFGAVRGAASVMRKTGGAIVLVSTVAARVGLPNHEAIAAAKGGVIGLMQSAAATYASKGIRVNAVAPGLTRTPATARLTASAGALQRSEALHPLGRIGEPDDVASALAWLLDPAQAWVTGQVIGVDGGLSTVRP